MNGWTRGESTEGNGYTWLYESDDHTEECEEHLRDNNLRLNECICGVESISVFEDTSEGVSQFYAWRGTLDDHDRATPTGLYPTLDEAVAALDR